MFLIDIGEIKVIRIINKSKVGLGLIAGIIAGAAFGYAITEGGRGGIFDFTTVATLGGGLSFGLIGAAFGAFSGKD